MTNYFTGSICQCIYVAFFLNKIKYKSVAIFAFEVSEVRS